MRKRRQWSREKICKTIRSLHNAGYELNYQSMQQVDKPLLEAGRTYFGSWGEAIEAAGFDYSKIKKTHSPGYWSKERVIEHIHHLHKKGEPLNSNYVQQDCQRVYGAAVRYWGSWGKAIKAAGFDYEDIRKRPEGRSWSKKLIIDIIQEREREGKSLNTMIVIDEDYALYVAVCRYYSSDSWKSALSDAGIDPGSIPDPRLMWTEESIIAKIKELHSEGKPLYPSYMNSHGFRGFVSCARNIFGSYKDAIEAAGLNYEEIRAVNWSRWSVRRVLSEIRALDDAGEDLNAGYINTHHSNLWNAAQRRFPSWASAVETAGIDYEEHRLQGPYLEWSTDRVISSVQNLHNKGEDLSPSGIIARDRRLYDACCSYFGSWEHAVKAAGLDPQDLRKVRFWNAKKIIRKIREIYANDEPLNATHIMHNHPGLYGAAFFHCESWANAVSEAGIDYLSVRGEWSTQYWLSTLTEDDIKKLEDEIQ